MKTEQVLIAMIQNPGKKFTNGRRTTSFENHGVAVVYGHNNACIHCTVLRFLKAFAADTWTEQAIVEANTMSTSELALIAIELEVEHRQLREGELDVDTLPNRIDVLFDLVRRLTVEVGKYQLERP